MKKRRGWHKADGSNGSGGNNCVEVKKVRGGGRRVRHSKHPKGPKLDFTKSEWKAFIGGVKKDEFD